MAPYSESYSWTLLFALNLIIYAHVIHFSTFRISDSGKRLDKYWIRDIIEKPPMTATN